MPYGQCPVCDAQYHLSIGMPVVEWYHRYWPEVRVGDPVPGKCPRCWYELRPGHHVTVRSVPVGLEGRVEVGDRGVVTSVEPGDPHFQVALEASAIASGGFHRTDLFSIVGQKADIEPRAALILARHPTSLG